MSGAGVLTASRTGSFAHGTGTFATVWVTCLVSLVAVVTLILLSRYGLKFLEPYLSRLRQTRNLALVESLAIDPRRRVSMIRCGEKTALILTGGGNDVFLGWMDGDRASHAAPPANSESDPRE
jgi:flagellar protein FliO/FliZ